VVLNTIFQIKTSEEVWNSFNIFNFNPDNNVLIITLFFFFFFLIGAFSSYCFLYNKINFPPRNEYIIYNFKKYDVFFKVILLMNVITFLITQYFMGNANIINIYILGGVNAQLIESKIASSPLGIHGISLLLGYFGILMYGMARLLNDKRPIVLISLIIIIIKFISYAKLQSLLYVFLGLMLYSPKKISFTKGSCVAIFTIILFSVTRIIRNPDQDLSFNFEFILRFIGGFYFGSPVVNFSYIVQNNISDIFYFFNWFLPQKIIPASTISLYFPDSTSPIGLVGSSYVSLGFFSFVYAFFIGFIAQYIFLKRNRTPFSYIFQPFLVMACLFSMMYNNFVNMNFFILPLIFTVFLVKRILRAKRI
ncbi:oligosaccharide repeat unit polymerase, partial [Salmonella enterica subsp. enterica serovar Havana]|nr:oligosaccharide repeat unit polymerase [Salmonella enterica subsp. enterica serovar Havana]